MCHSIMLSGYVLIHMNVSQVVWSLLLHRNVSERSRTGLRNEQHRTGWMLGRTRALSLTTTLSPQTNGDFLLNGTRRQHVSQQ